MYGSETYPQGAAHHRGSDFMVGVLCGAAVGAAIGLLMAPKPGSEFRHQLADSAGRWRGKVSGRYDQAAAKVENLVDRGREAMRKGREKYDETRAEFADAASPIE